MPKKKTFEMRNTQYSIELSVHKQTNVFNTTYTIQCRENCQIILQAEQKKPRQLPKQQSAQIKQFSKANSYIFETAEDRANSIR